MNQAVDEDNPQAQRVWVEFVTALESLAPETRAAFLLHEVFEASYEDTARLVGLSSKACREHVEFARHQAARQIDRTAHVPPGPTC